MLRKQDFYTREQYVGELAFWVNEAKAAHKAGFRAGLVVGFIVGAFLAFAAIGAVLGGL